MDLTRSHSDSNTLCLYFTGSGPGQSRGSGWGQTNKQSQSWQTLIFFVAEFNFGVKYDDSLQWAINKLVHKETCLTIIRVPTVRWARPWSQYKMLMCKLLQCPRLDLILKYPHLCVNFIVIFNNRIIIYTFLQLKFHNNTLQNLSHDVQISRGEMTLSRVLARQNDGDTNNDKLVLCHCCVANWTKPRAWFCGLSLGLAEVFTPKFCYLSRRGELSRYQVWTIGLHDKWTSAQLFCRFPWTLFGVCFDVRPN